ncbi:SAM-dependent methyltransferase [Helicobacter himalayensis]|uniref:SAM-dependent methyltransferase n=1 Tax=Helicobacter himalayensis TaxID=1591088 RepID=UPI003D6EB2ED
MLSLSAWLESSLYAESGYYNNPARVGKEGDFYTSVSVSRFFGAGIANYILKLLESNALRPPLYIIEIGAHKGFLLKDIADFLRTLGRDSLFSQLHFCTIEPLMQLQEAQKATLENLKNFCVHNSLQSLESTLKPNGQSLFFVSNELLDSLCVDIFMHNSMFFVNGDCGLWVESKRQNLTLAQKDLLFTLEKLNLNGAYPPSLKPFLTQIAQCARKSQSAYFLTFDYDKLGARNPNSFIRAYKNHQVFSFEEIQNLGFNVFYQTADMTADVDFEFVAYLFKNLQFLQVFNKAQNKVLLEECALFEVVESFEKSCDFSLYQKEAAKLRALLDPQILGERFRGVCFCYNAPL